MRPRRLPLDIFLQIGLEHQPPLHPRWSKLGDHQEIQVSETCQMGSQPMLYAYRDVLSLKYCQVLRPRTRLSGWWLKVEKGHLSNQWGDQKPVGSHRSQQSVQSPLFRMGIVEESEHDHQADRSLDLVVQILGRYSFRRSLGGFHQLLDWWAIWIQSGPFHRSDRVLGDKAAVMD